MGWTKRPEAVLTLQGARSNALSSVRKLTKTARTKELSEEDQLTLGRELHSEMRRFNSLQKAVGGDRPSLEVPVLVLLQLIPKFTFTKEV